MIQDIAPLKYDNHYEEQEPSAGDWLMVYRNGDVLCRFEGEDIYFPRVEEIQQENKETTYLFSISGEHFFLLKNDLEKEPEDYIWENPMIFREVIPRYRGFAGITAQHLSSEVNIS